MLQMGIFLLSLSFDPPKESDQRKGGRKRQPPLFFAICAEAISRSKKHGAVRAFSGLPAHRRIQYAGIATGICFSIKLLAALEITYYAPSGLIVTGDPIPRLSPGGKSPKKKARKRTLYIRRKQKDIPGSKSARHRGSGSGRPIVRGERRPDFQKKCSEWSELVEGK